MFSSITFTDTTDTIKEYDQKIHTDINNLNKLAQIFPKSVGEIQELTTATISLAKQEIQTIKENNTQTFNSTMHALDICFHKLNVSISIIHILGDTHPDEAIRNAALDGSKTLQEFGIDMSMDADLFHIVQNYYDHHSQNETLSPEDHLLVTDYLKACKRAGLHLPESVLQEVKTIQKEICALEQDFLVNINNDDSNISATLEELQGVNKNFIKQLTQNEGTYIVPCDLASYITVMTECSVEQTRKNLFFVRNTRIYPQNDTILVQLLTKRQELATLLGHEHFASLDLEQTSAKNLNNIENFLLPLADQFLKKNEEEFHKLKQDLPESVTLQENGTINQWDYFYTHNQYIKKHFAVDESKVAEYFPAQKVIDGIFTIYQDFLGLTFKQVQPEWSWHEDVLLIEIYRTSSNQLLGYLFLDLYPRANKFSHACVQPILHSYNESGANNTSAAALIMNVPKPSEDTPALLKHRDVVTFFHEFGHAMHHVLSRPQNAGHAGLRVAVDFVETPSQMFEQWMFEPDMLNIVSSHYKTGEPLPKEIIENKIKLRQVDAGYTMLRQCMIGLFALYSMNNNDLSYKPASLWKSLHEKYLTPFMNYEENYHWFTTFGHLASGLYASKYYSYLWTEVFALDLFASIKEHNFNEEYSQKVIEMLSAGGSVKPEELLQNFLGRQPNQTALLKALGL